MKTAFVKTSLMIVAFGLVPASVSGQNLTGSVVADDTGSPLVGATVVATQKTASFSQRPSIYKVLVDGAGQYSMTLPAGQYQLCVHSAGVYLDPCLWGSAGVASVASAAVSVHFGSRKALGSLFACMTHGDICPGRKWCPDRGSPHS
jgi:hypothetical protein